MNVKFALCIVGLLILALPFNAFAQPVIGACCSPAGSCSIAGDGQCQSEGGTFMGNGTSCDPNPCPRQQPTAVPTMNEWGMIIFVLLVGLGGVYYLRRHRRA